MLYRLIILTGPQTGQRVTVGADPLVIGRDPECDIAVDDPECALRHAEVVHDGDLIRIRDLGSMTRLVVNRREVGEARLKHGDVVELGRTRMLVQCSVQAEVLRPARAARRRRRAALALALAVAAAGYAAWRSLPRTRPAPEVPAVARVQEPPAPAPTPMPREAPVPPSVAASDPKLKAELEEVRRQLADLGGTVRDLQGAPASAPPSAPSTSTFRPADPLRERVSKILAQARDEAAAGNMDEADRLLTNVQILDADQLEAYVQRAALMEKRGMVKKAIEQWSSVAARSAGTPLYERAVAERIRLERLDRGEPSSDPALRIVNTDVQRFPAGEEYAEMRLLKVLVAPAGPGPLDGAAVRLEVTFFADGPDPASPQVVTTVVAGVEGPWAPGAERTLTATYVVPKGAGAPPPFKGFVAGLFYRGQLQGAEAKPASLLVAGRDGRDVL